jgi:hypothetical protein
VISGDGQGRQLSTTYIMQVTSDMNDTLKATNLCSRPLQQTALCITCHSGISKPARPVDSCHGISLASLALTCALQNHDPAPSLHQPTVTNSLALYLQLYITSIPRRPHFPTISYPTPPDTPSYPDPYPTPPLTPIIISFPAPLLLQWVHCRLSDSKTARNRLPSKG